MNKKPDDLQFTVHNVKKVGHNNGIGRVSDDAAAYIAMELEKRAEKMLRRSHELAGFCGRETVKEEDVRFILSMEEDGVYP